MSNIVKEIKKENGLHHIVEMDGYMYALDSCYVERDNRYETLLYLYDEKTEQEKSIQDLMIYFNLSDMVEGHMNRVNNLENYFDTYKVSEQYPIDYPIPDLLYKISSDSLEVDYLKPQIPQIVDNFLERFKHFECSDNYDLDALKKNPEQLFEVLSGLNENEKLKDDMVIENNTNNELSV